MKRIPRALTCVASAPALLDLHQERLPPRPRPGGDLVPWPRDVVLGAPLAAADAVELVRQAQAADTSQAFRTGLLVMGFMPSDEPTQLGWRAGEMCPVLRPADRRPAAVRLGVFGLVVALAFMSVTVVGISSGDAQRWVADAGPVGPLVFVLAGGALGLALFPGHVTATVAGVLFGTLAGTALALAAGLLGAGLCLVAARYLGAHPVESLLGPRARRRRAWVTEHGFVAVLASRLAPGVPAGMVNYLAGLAGIRPSAFFAAVALGALPKTIAYVALGGALSEPLSTRGALAAALYLAAAVGGALLARWLFRSAPRPAAD